MQTKQALPPKTYRIPKLITEVRDFLAKAKRKDAKSIKVKKNDGVTKYKLRCSKYLYTLVLDDESKATKLDQSLPSDLTRKDL